MMNSKSKWLQALLVTVCAIYFLNNYKSKNKKLVWNVKNGHSYLYEYKSNGVIEGDSLDQSLRVSMKADLVRYVESKNKTGWTEALYLKNIDFFEDPFALKKWANDLRQGISIRRNKNGKIVNWESISGNTENPFWRRILQQTSIILPDDRASNWSVKDFDDDKFTPTYSSEKSISGEIDLYKSVEYYQGRDHFQRKTEINLKSPYARIVYLSESDMSEKFIGSEKLISNTTTELTYLSHDIIKIAKESPVTIKKLNTTQKDSKQFKKSSKILLRETETMKDYISLKKILQNTPGITASLENEYLSLEPSSKAFRNVTKALMSISGEEELRLISKALKENIDNKANASYLIASLSLAKHPNKPVVDMLERITSENSDLYTEASLGLGVMADKLKKTDINLSETILKNRIRKINTTEDQLIKNTELSSIGNMGLESSLSFLKKMLAETSADTRLHALKAMRRVEDREVNSIYIQLLNSDPDSRLAEQASYFLAQRKLDNMQLQDLKNQLFKDHNQQIKLNLIRAYTAQVNDKDARIVVSQLLKTIKSTNVKEYLKRKYH